MINWSSRRGLNKLRGTPSYDTPESNQGGLALLLNDGGR